MTKAKIDRPQGRPRILEDGCWGVISTAALDVGAEITVTTKKGRRWEATINEVDSSNGKSFVYTTTEKIRNERSKNDRNPWEKPPRTKHADQQRVIRTIALTFGFLWVLTLVALERLTDAVASLSQCGPTLP